ncbi:MAG: OadG family protein [Clostridia bacterium]|nr:hypothetical protein [Oscillospiraceae bacterium]MBQ2827752.1 OadG family protein [Clostridia bacterium]
MIGQTLGLLTGKALETSDVLMVCVVGIIVVIVELALIAFCITGVSKAINGLTKATKKKMKAEAPASSAPAAVAAPAQAAAPVAVAVKKDPELIDVDEKSAAIIMAIVSDESGIPLERLAFKSIKKID